MADTAPLLLPGTTGLALTGFFALATLLCLARVVWQDLRRFEIDFAALGGATFAMLSLIVMLDGLTGALDALATGALFGCVADALRRPLPGAMGAGDPPLFAALGVAAGFAYFLPALVACALFSLLAAMVYAHARGKRLFRSMFPAAVALVPAIILALVLRLLDAGGVRPPVLAALALPLTPAMAWVVAGLALLVLLAARMRRWRASLFAVLAHRRGLVPGACFGAAAPIIGMFLGLQVAPALGTIFMAPFVALTLLTGIPIGMMPVPLRGVGFVLSILTGAALGYLVQALIRKVFP